MAGRYEFRMKAERHPDTLPIAHEPTRAAPRLGSCGDREDKRAPGLGFVQDSPGIRVEIHMAVKINQVTPRF